MEEITEDVVRSAILSATSNDEAWAVAKEFADKGWWSVAISALMDSYEGQ